jgi:hypothetical protein
VALYQLQGFSTLKWTVEVRTVQDVAVYLILACGAVSNVIKSVSGVIGPPATHPRKEVLRSCVYLMLINTETLQPRYRALTLSVGWDVTSELRWYCTCNWRTLNLYQERGLSDWFRSTSKTTFLDVLRASLSNLDKDYWHLCAETNSG